MNILTLTTSQLNSLTTQELRGLLIFARRQVCKARPGTKEARDAIAFWKRVVDVLQGRCPALLEPYRVQPAAYAPGPSM